MKCNAYIHHAYHNGRSFLIESTDFPIQRILNRNYKRSQHTYILLVLPVELPKTLKYTNEI